MGEARHTARVIDVCFRHTRSSRGLSQGRTHQLLPQISGYATAAATHADSHGKSFKVVTINIEIQIVKLTECQAATQGKL